ncbi:MAG: hypothetical protein KC445_05800 [Anaerolineales bacterium]|nr:hypothetical protein [Anaerolineales bacterium]
MFHGVYGRSVPATSDDALDEGTDVFLSVESQYAHGIHVSHKAIVMENGRF